MGAFANVLVIIMLVIAAAVGLALWVTALKQVIQSPLEIGAKILWLLLVVLTGPIGLVIWFAVGYGDSRRQVEIAHHQAWERRTHADTTVDIEALAEAQR